MLAYQARPLDPALVGDVWRDRWLERIATLPFFPALWLEHQRYDAYWKHGSVCEDFAAITCPVLAVGGWVDSYTNAVPRLLAGLKVPRLGVIGPWGHIYPHDGVPGPAIGFLQEAVRWWDHWLKGRETGVMDQPMLRAYLQDPVPPDGTRTMTPGRWVGLEAYPSAAITTLRLNLQLDGDLSATVAGIGELSIRSPQSHGKAGGEWMGAGCPGEHPTDQRLDDGAALVFETAPLAHEQAVLGFPKLTLDLASDAPVAHLVARLSDIAPDGRATRVSYQVLNLTHRDSHESPTPLEPGRFYSVALDLNLCGHRFLPGHRIRLSIATAYWPMIWPAPEAATLAVRTGDSALELPVLADRGPPVEFPPPAHGPLTPVTQLDPGYVRRYSTQDHVTGQHTYVTEAVGGVFGEGVIRFDDIGTEVSHSLKRELTIHDDDPLSARYFLTQSFEMGRDGWRTRIETRNEMHADAGTFYLTGELKAFEAGELVATRTWDEAIPRDLL
jgi:predicted acyl esterase